MRAIAAKLSDEEIAAVPAMPQDYGETGGRIVQFGYCPHIFYEFRFKIPTRGGFSVCVSLRLSIVCGSDHRAGLFNEIGVEFAGLLGVSSVVFGAKPEEFKQDVDYELIDPPQPTVDPSKSKSGFFWYKLSTAITSRPDLNAWLKKKPDNVVFVRQPAISMRAGRLTPGVLHGRGARRGR